MPEYSAEELARAKVKASKLLALAQRGVGGEAINAAALLERTLEKYGLSQADLAAEGEPRAYRFGFQDRWERDLLLQVIRRVLNTKVAPGQRTKTSKVFILQLTPFQHAEADLMYTVYRAAWKAEQKKLFIAFISRNAIYEQQDSDVPSKLDPWEEYQIGRMMAGMKFTQIPRGMLTEGDGAG